MIVELIYAYCDRWLDLSIIYSTKSVHAKKDRYKHLKKLDKKINYLECSIYKKLKNRYTMYISKIIVKYFLQYVLISLNL